MIRPGLLLIFAPMLALACSLSGQPSELVVTASPTVAMVATTPAAPLKLAMGARVLAPLTGTDTPARIKTIKCKRGGVCFSGR